jgi:hypothetical protein
VFFLVLGLWLVARGRRVWGGVALAASFLVKYLAAVLLPFCARRGLRRVVPVALAVAVIGYLPFLHAGADLTRSLRAYGANWSFNGPPFMILSGLFGDGAARAVLLAVGGVWLVVAAWRVDDAARFAYLAVGAALLLSPTVYPWYLVWMVPFLSIFPSRAWLSFTGLVVLSYWVWLVYQESGAWMLPSWVLLLEYVPLYAMLLWKIPSWVRPRPR